METWTVVPPPQRFRSHRPGTQTMRTIGLGKADRSSLRWEVEAKAEGGKVGKKSGARAAVHTQEGAGPGPCSRWVSLGHILGGLRAGEEILG